MESANDAREYLANLLTKGAETPVDVDPDYELKLPDYADEKTIKKAQKLLADNYMGATNASFTGLLTILAIPSILKVLIFTNKSSSNYTAYKRYVQTIYHTLTWYRNDFRPGTRAWKSLETVRKLHFSATKSASRNNVGIVSQKDMAITQYGFMGYLMTSGEKIGVFLNREEKEWILHFWRVHGYLLGIHDEFNICTDSYEKSMERIRIIQDEILVPAIQNPPKEFREMTKYIVDGLWAFNPLGDYDAAVFSIKRLLKIPGYHYWADEEDKNTSNGVCELKKLGWFTRYNLYSDAIIMECLLQYWIFRTIFNFQGLFFEKMSIHFPFLAMCVYGFKRAFVSILDGSE